VVASEEKLFYVDLNDSNNRGEKINKKKKPFINIVSVNDKGKIVSPLPQMIPKENEEIVDKKKSI